MEQTRYGRMTVLTELDCNKWGYRMVKCRCDCGVERVVSLYDLKRKHTQSCGCFRTEQSIKASTTHGKAHTPTHNSWRGMLERCVNPHHQMYRYYGGKGITVCDRWLSSFDNFYADMGEKPDGLSLDRIDPKGNYEGSNCRWATPKEQSRNSGNNHILTYKGKSQCIAAWAEEIGMRLTTFRMRIFRGWTTEEAIETPIR